MKTVMHHALTTFPRAGGGGSRASVVVEPDPLTASQRLALARAIGHLTAFIPRSTPDPLPAVFYDEAGERATGEQGLLAVYRTLALSGRLTGHRVILETASGLVALQEEVFRNPGQAQVWIGLELPPLERLEGPPCELRAHLGLPEGCRTWQSGPTLLVEGGSLARVRATRLEPLLLRELLPAPLEELLLFTLEPSSLFSDVHVRHITTRGHGRELPASVLANAALAAALWHEGHHKAHLLIDQGVEIGAPSRVSIWLEGDGPRLLRLSVGGQVNELERIERPRPAHCSENP